MHTDDPQEIEVLVGDGLVSEEDLRGAGLLGFYEDYIDMCLSNMRLSDM
jgi:hypothetical protein